MAQRRIGKYRVLDGIASGTQGSVYRAYDAEEGRIVALKILHPTLTADATFLERFKREAALAASVDHPNVIRIFDVGESDGQHFIALEFLPETLDRVIESGALPVRIAAGIAAGIADGLGAVHDLGIVHRDLKPQNVLITPEGTPKVTDFGIARAEALGTMTATGVLMGTPFYMSPEQADGKRADARSDVYALGCVLYQLLTGEVPFQAETPLAVLKQHIERQPRPVESLRDDVPHSLVAIVNKALSKDPNERYENGKAMAQALRLAVPGVQGTAIAPIETGVAIGLPANGGSHIGTATLTWVRHSRQRQTLLALTALAILGIVVGLAIVLMGNNAGSRLAVESPEGDTGGAVGVSEETAVDTDAPVKADEANAGTSESAKSALAGGTTEALNLQDDGGRVEGAPEELATPILPPAVETATLSTAALAIDENDGSAPFEVRFIDESTGSPESWLWDFGDGETSKDQNPTHTYTQAGTYDVGVTVDGPGGVDQTAIKDAVIVRAGASTKIDSAIGNLELHVGETIQLSASVTDQFDNPTDTLLSWNIDTNAGDIDQSGLFTAGEKSGDFPDGLLIVAADSSGEIELRFDVTILAGPMVMATLNLPAPTQVVGDVFRVDVTAIDEFGNPVSIESVSWESSAAEIDNGEHTALRQAGIYDNGISAIVTAGEVTVEATASIELVPADFARIQFAKKTLIVRPGGSVPLGVITTDRFGNVIEDVPLFFTATDGFNVGGDFRVSSAAEGILGTIVASAQIGTREITADVQLASPPVFLPIGNLLAVDGDGTTMTFLNDGRVLIVNGAPEVFDPTTLELKLVGNLNTRHGWHTATRLNDGRVAIIGGNCGDAIELFDPATDSFALSSATLSDRRGGHTATLLDDGRVLIGGGETCGGADSLTSVEIFDPITDTVERGPSDLITSRANHFAIKLPDGKILFGGGFFQTGATNGCRDHFETYDALSGVVERTGGFAQTGNCLAGRGKAFPILSTGHVGSVPFNQFVDLYDIAGGVGIIGPEWRGDRNNHSVAELSGDKVMITGGENGSVEYAESFIVDLATGDETVLPAMAVPRFSHDSIALPDESVLVMGGYSFTTAGVWETIVPHSLVELFLP